MLLGLGAIIMQIASVALIVLLVVSLKQKKESKILDLVSSHFLKVGLFVSASAVVFSLIYSDILNFPPCHFCWYARVFMYPQMFIFAVALYMKDRKVIAYSFPLLVAGLLLSLYHNFMYYFGETTNAPCDASGVSCYQHLVSEFGGYISIPMLSLTSVVALLAVVLVAHFYKRQDNN